MTDDTVRSPRDPDPPAPAPEAADWDEVAAFLADPASHGATEPVVRIDTHAAVVFLAGPLAYKIKRPVRFPFLDYATLSARAEACRREIAVDRPIAPSIYRRTVAITREADGRLAIGGAGRPVEWAVEMNRFDEADTLDRRLAAGPLEPTLVDALADAVAAAQTRARRRDGAPWIADLGRYLAQNAAAFADRPDLFEPEAALRLERRAAARLAELGELLADRDRLGRIRLGHGDLHSGNVAVIDGRPQLFDAIEFDEAIATGDLLYDAGFLIMDLEERGDRAAAARFLDRWLLATVRQEAARGRADPAEVLYDEIGALAALPLFLSIRAALRAKIAAATAQRLVGPARAAAEAAARRFFAGACAALDPNPPMLVAIGGLSGSGKTTLARTLAPELDPAPGALVLRTDALRKLFAGVDETTRLGPEHYTAAASARIYDRIAEAASRALAAGRSVIVDAVALAPEERRRLERVAALDEVAFVGLWLEVAPETAAARVGGRRGDASDADAAVVAFQAGIGAGAVDWPRIVADGSPSAIAAAARTEIARRRPV